MRRLLMLMTLVGFMACNRTHQSEKQNQMLFNGANLAGWEVAIEADAELADATELFVVKNGLIRVAGDPFGYLYTVGSYSKYELSFEWRWVGEPTNSGVFIHVQNPGDVWPRAYEYQLMAGKAGDMVMLGGAKLKNYPCEGEFPIKPRVGDYENKAGAWNKGKIIVKGGEIEFYTNGKLQNKATAKFKSGHIALQSEGGPLEFRNICLKDIK